MSSARTSGASAAFVRLAPGVPELGVAAVEPASEESLSGECRSSSMRGVNVSRLKFNPSDKGATPERDVSTTGPHVAIGVRGAVSQHSDLGTRIEMDEIDGSTS